MKKDIHPEYIKCQVICACGNKFETRAFTGEQKIEICNICHPFFTGKMKLLDTEGRVERFNRKYAKPGAKATSSQA